MSDRNISHKRITSEENDSPVVVTVETNLNENSYNFLKTLSLRGWDYFVYGIGKPWTGFGCKLQYYSEALAELHPERLVVLCDARDVFCTRSPRDFLTAFHGFQKPILVSMENFCGGKIHDPQDEKMCWDVPLNSYWDACGIKKPDIRPYVNSGLIAGRVKDIMAFLLWALSKKYTDDQQALGFYINQFPQRVATDAEAKILHTSGFGVNGATQSSKQWCDSPTVAELTGFGAFFLHIAGLGAPGQKKIYDLVKTLLLDMKVSNDWLLSEYPPHYRDSYNWNSGWGENPSHEE